MPTRVRQPIAAAIENRPMPGHAWGFRACLRDRQVWTSRPKRPDASRGAGAVVPRQRLHPLGVQVVTEQRVQEAVDAIERERVIDRHDMEPRPG